MALKEVKKQKIQQNWTGIGRWEERDGQERGRGGTAEEGWPPGPEAGAQGAELSRHLWKQNCLELKSKLFPLLGCQPSILTPSEIFGWRSWQAEPLSGSVWSPRGKPRAGDESHREPQAEKGLLPSLRQPPPQIFQASWEGFGFFTIPWKVSFNLDGKRRENKEVAKSVSSNFHS